MICRPWRDASTISLPQGEIDADPTGLSNRKDAFSPNVGLSKADDGPLEPLLPSMLAYDRKGPELLFDIPIGMS